MSGSYDLGTCEGPGHILCECHWPTMCALGPAESGKCHKKGNLQLQRACQAERHPLAVGSGKNLWRSGIQDGPGRFGGVQTGRDEGRALQAEGTCDGRDPCCVL